MTQSHGDDHIFFLKHFLKFHHIIYHLCGLGEPKTVRGKTRKRKIISKILICPQPLNITSGCKRWILNVDGGVRAHKHAKNEATVLININANNSNTDKNICFWSTVRPRWTSGLLCQREWRPHI